MNTAGKENNFVDTKQKKNTYTWYDIDIDMDEDIRMQMMWFYLCSKFVIIFVFSMSSPQKFALFSNNNVQNITIFSIFAIASSRLGSGEMITQCCNQIPEKTIRKMVILPRSALLFAMNFKSKKICKNLFVMRKKNEISMEISNKQTQTIETMQLY